MFAAEIRVELLEKKPIEGIDKTRKFSVGGLVIAVRACEKSHTLSLTASGFETEEAARNFVPKLIRGLYNMALVHDIAFEPTFDELSIMRTPVDPEVVAKNLFKGAGDTPVRVHGVVTSGEGFFIRREDEIIAEIRGLRPTVTASKGWKVVEGSMISGVSAAVQEDRPLSENVASALDLYLAHFRESTVRARLLTLVSALELLADQPERPVEVQDRMNEFAQILREKATRLDEPSLKSGLQRASNYLLSNAKRESIKEAVRRLAESIASDGEVEPRDFVRRIADAYDTRSKLSHGDDVSEKAVAVALADVRKALRLALQREIGVLRDTGPKE